MADEYVYKQVESISFGLLSPMEVEKMSSVKVVTPELYDKEGYPVDGGLMDIRLGVIDPGLRCKTCGGKLKECMGHFGYVELARPIIHIKYVKPIMDALRSTCRECAKILLQDKDVEKWKLGLERAEKEKNLDARREKTRELVNSLKNIRKCPHCKSKQYSIKIEKPTTFYENDRRLTPIEIKARLERISDDDSLFLGFNPKAARPEWMILTLLVIPPVTMRPSITLETGERSEDDLTHKLGDVVRINQRLFENINAGAPEIIVEDLWDLLQYHVTTYIDNTITQVPPARHRSGQALKTITERIKSKEGRFRHNLAGKRVNFAARAVISPDPRIKFNEVGIPLSVAMELTVPEKVNEWNLERLREFVKKGPANYPGANYVLRPDGKKKQITDETQELLLTEMKEGFIVERHLMDGDIAIFNRQPSLHRMSIMCHKVKVLPGKSFRLNPSVCEPYNADFDGDEMNFHIPQTEEARAEAEILMQVQTQIVTPKNGTNVIGCVEDSVTGNYLLTKGEGLKLSKEEVVELLSSIGIKNFEKLKKQNYNGKEVFSMILPRDFNFSGYSKAYKKSDDKKPKIVDDAIVAVRNGELISGVIDTNSIGHEKGKLIREYFRKYGADKTLEFIAKVFRLGIKVLLKLGFTTTIGDTDLTDKITNEIQDLIENAEKETQKLIQIYRNEELEALPGKTLRETLEIKILELLNNVRNKIGEIIAQTSSEVNPTIIMAKSGAKGNLLNLTMMAACVGQQSLRGERIADGYRRRTLSLFRKGDLGPEAHGFVKNSFKLGLTPYEFFFHAMTGRDSLMDTALRTPKSGYLYRRLANALQDIKVEYDSTVRDANKAIVQFKYGEDGVDVSKSEGGIVSVAAIVKEAGEK
ncbi:MAG TPA: DNA-directed RNA polymerase subunit A' [Candidatus Nanoarchaeia archaeon]|nr:DNA-directed RNA polymerase subunit A' [Candidatus Nanoarchaeia archaeon]